MEKIATTDSTIAFIGLGLIGGPIVRAIRKAWPDICIVAYVRSHSRLEQVWQEGTADVILDGTDENLRECDLIFLCTPVEYDVGYFSVIQSYLKQGVLVTGVGSTKRGVHEEIGRQNLEYCFMGGHLMAGSGKTGYRNSMDHLLGNACHIVTSPEGKNSFHPQALSPNVECVMAAARVVDAIPLVLDYRERDKVVAAISHLPHLVAFSLVNSTKDHDAVDGIMKQVATGDFKDITRIVFSSPEVWEQICITDVGPVSDILEAYITSLNKVLKEIREHKGQDIYRLFETSRDYHNSVISKAKGSVKPFYKFAVDISDEVGVISTISVILAIRGTNIKNIDINNNRERGEGALKIAFHNKASMGAVWQGLDKYKHETFYM